MFFIFNCLLSIKNKRENAIHIIECLINQFYLNKESTDVHLLFRFYFELKLLFNFQISILIFKNFRTLLSLDLADGVEIEDLKRNIDISKLEVIKKNVSQFVSYAICYWFVKCLN